MKLVLVVNQHHYVIIINNLGQLNLGGVHCNCLYLMITHNTTCCHNVSSAHLHFALHDLHVHVVVGVMRKYTD